MRPSIYLSLAAYALHVHAQNLYNAQRYRPDCEETDPTTNCDGEKYSYTNLESNTCYNFGDTPPTGFCRFFYNDFVDCAGPAPRDYQIGTFEFDLVGYDEDSMSCEVFHDRDCAGGADGHGTCDARPGINLWSNLANIAQPGFKSFR